MAVVVVLFAGLLVAHHLGHLGASAPHTVTTTTLPVQLSVGSATCTFVDPSRDTEDFVTDTSIPGRRLDTELYYPALPSTTTGGSSSTAGTTAGSSAARLRPASRHGPFPTIVFAAGYGIDPSSYSELIDSWVRAGFVVVAPIFPDASTAAVAAIGGSQADEEDVPDQPADITFVTRHVIADSAGTGSGCGVLRGMVDRSELGLAGQSDGATAVGILAFVNGTVPGTTTTTYASLSAGLDYRAVAVLSGQGWGNDTYSSTASSPAALFVQSATDTCNTPAQAVDLYSALDQPDRWFLAIRSADHLTPYEGQDVAAFGVVSKVTTAFFDAELHRHAPGSAFAAAGSSAPTVATLAHGSALPTWITSASPGSGGVGCYQT